MCYEKSTFYIIFVVSHFFLFYVYKILRSTSPQLTSMMYFCLAFLVFTIIATVWFIFDVFKMWYRNLDKEEHLFVSFMELIEGLG